MQIIGSAALAELRSSLASFPVAGLRALRQFGKTTLLICWACTAQPSGGDLDGAPGAVWTLSEAPEFSVSESAEEPAYHLFNAWSGVILDDGTIVVRNLGTHNLIYFDSTGRALKIAGREGDGPGEFRQIFGLYQSGHRVAVWDNASRRVSFFSTAGEFLHSPSLPSQGVRTVQGFLRDGGFVTTTDSAPGTKRGIQIWNEQGELELEIAGLPEPPSSLISWSVPRSGGRMGRSSTSLPAGCTPFPIETVVDSVIIALDAAAGVVMSIDPSGRSRELYTASSRTRVTESLRDSVRNGLRDRYGGEGGIPSDTIESAVERIGGIGDPLPAWSGVVSDPSGRVWLEIARCPSAPTLPRRFEIIDLEGRLLGRISIPPDLLLLAVRGDRVLVTSQDTLDVQHLQLRRIVQ
jgi:hypothetical protein